MTAVFHQIYIDTEQENMISEIDARAIKKLITTSGDGELSILTSRV